MLPGYFEQDVRLSLFFENEVLAYFTGDFAPTPPDQEVEPTQQTTESADTDEIATS